MVLAPNKTLAAQLYGEMKSSSENAVEYFVSYYDYYQPEAYVPSSDTFIEKDASVNEHIEQMRLSATKARCWSVVMWWWWPRCRRSTAWAIRISISNDAAPDAGDDHRSACDFAPSGGVAVHP